MQPPSEAAQCLNDDRHVDPAWRQALAGANSDMPLRPQLERVAGSPEHFVHPMDHRVENAAIVRLEDVDAPSGPRYTGQREEYGSRGP